MNEHNEQPLNPEEHREHAEVNPASGAVSAPPESIATAAPASSMEPAAGPLIQPVSAPPPAIGPVSPAAPYYASAPIVAKPSIPPFQAELKDSIFALAAFVLGYMFCRWVLTSFYGWGIAVFTALFLSAATAYFLARGIKPDTRSWFWFSVTLLTGLSFALWSDIGIAGLRTLFLFCAAVYWVLSATNVRLDGKTSNFLLLDGLNGVFAIPFRNFANQYRALGALRRSSKRDGKKALSIILGIVLALIALLIVTPQLLRADSGGFYRLIESIVNLFTFDWSHILEFLFYCLLAIPTAAYLFGLLSGSAAKRATDAFKADKAGKTVEALRILPPATAFIVLGAVCLLYIVFIACQLPYFFSAFAGSRPEGWLSFSAYARQGFFELCRLSAVNLFLLAAANILSRKPRSESLVLKVFNIVLALITLLLIATAFSKMALYIDAFGLTILRILPCVFMVFLAVVCVAVVMLQKLHFSIVRVALITGAVLFTALCLADADTLVVRYNTDRYLAGTLTDYDTDILNRAGPAGVADAVRVYSQLPDGTLKNDIQLYLRGMSGTVQADAGTYRDTVQSAQARAALRGLGIK
jgi:hypothetical protein